MVGRAVDDNVCVCAVLGREANIEYTKIGQ